VDPCRYRILKHGTRDRQRACGVEDVVTSYYADAGYDTVVPLRVSVGSTHIEYQNRRQAFAALAGVELASDVQPSYECA
jgi:hypothetical protein